MTVLTLDCLKENLIYFGFQTEDSDEVDLLTNESEEIVAIDRFQKVYEGMFKKWNDFWIVNKDRSFMNLNNNLKAFREKVFKELKNARDL